MKKSIYVKNNKWLTTLCYSLAIILISSGIISLFSSGFGLIADTNTYWSSYQVSAQDNKLRTPENVAWFFYNSNATTATLECDVDMSAHMWNGPTGVTGNKTLNGKGHIIKGLKSNASSSGLVATSSSGTFNFSNLTLEISVTSSANGSVGGFVGEKTGGSLTLTNCKTIGSITNSNNQSSRCVGGLVGKTSSITLTRCFNYATISGSGSSARFGGLVGECNGTVTMSLCGNYANLNGNSGYSGGLIGRTNSINLKDARCFNSGNITDTSSSTDCGGLIGGASTITDNIVSYVYNTGKINSSGWGGGIISSVSSVITFNNTYNSADVVAAKNTDGKSQSNSTYSLSSGYIYSNGVEYTKYTGANISYAPIVIENDGGSSVDKEKCKYQVCLTSLTKYSSTDVSLVRDISKLKVGTNCYSVKPSCLKNNNTNKFQATFALKASGNTLSTISFDVDVSSSSSSSKSFSIELPLSGDNTYNGSKLSSIVDRYKSSSLIGVSYSYSGGIVTFKPYLKVDYTYTTTQMVTGSPGTGGMGGYSFPVTVVHDATKNASWFDGTLTTLSSAISMSYKTAAQIKSSTFGTTYFKQDNSINNGLPFFKEMYWEFA